MGRTAKFAHWSKLLVLPGIEEIKNGVSLSLHPKDHLPRENKKQEFTYWSIGFRDSGTPTIRK